MAMLIDFIKSLVYEIIFWLLLSCGLTAFITTKVKNVMSEKLLGINHIHKKGNNVKAVTKALMNAREVKIVSFLPFSLLFTYKNYFVDLLKNKCDIKILVCHPESQTLSEICRIEKRSDDDLEKLFPNFQHLLESIVKEAGINKNHSLELRTCNTEIRNPCLICIDKNNNIKSFLTISTPPKRSIDTLMLEFKNDHAKHTIDYFEAIWDLHNNDTIDIECNPSPIE